MRRPIRLGLAAALLTLAALALGQSALWMTGRPVAPRLDLTPADASLAPTTAIWIDTDAACGAAPRADPDDCFAILWLVARGQDIRGISTSFGNADSATVVETLARLSDQMRQGRLTPPPVYPGLAEPGSSNDPPGVLALREALAEGPLTILALGPLTNLAAALRNRPDLQVNVQRIVAVMGHRTGHVFHPSEGQGHGVFLGHGPIFRDLNVAVDPDAVAEVLALDLPLTLIPYDAGRSTLITGPDLATFASNGAAQAWLSAIAGNWLGFWQNEVGLSGFYPFDWVAAAWLADPTLFSCAPVETRLTTEWAMWVMPRRSLSVLPLPPGQTAKTLYCPQTSPLLHALLVQGN